jgi:hypothetical protein
MSLLPSSTNPSDTQALILSSVQKKIGNLPLRLEVTPNGRARLTIGTRKKDFINRKDALQWLIHSYNIKDCKNLISASPPPKTEPIVPNKKRKILNETAAEIYEKIIEFDYYSTEIYRSAIKELEGLKTEQGYSDEEVSLVYGILIDSLQKLMDETFHHKRSQTYKKYWEQLSMRNTKKS